MLRHDNQPQDRATAADERRCEVASNDERGQRRWTRVDKIGGKWWLARRQMRGDDQWSNLTSNQPRDRAMVVDKRRLDAAMADERGQWRRKREGSDSSGGREAIKVEARGGLPGSRREVTTIFGGG